FRGQNGQIDLWDAQAGQHLATLNGPSGAAKLSFDLSNDSSLVATATRGRVVRLWNAHTGQEIAELEHPGAVNSVLFTPDSRRILSISNDGAALLWGARTAAKVATIELQGELRDLAFATNGRRFVAMMTRPSVSAIYPTDTWQKILTLEGRPSGARAFSPDG